MLHQCQNDQDTFAALAKNIADEIRQSGYPEPLVYGRLGTLYVLIEVHWYYLIVPAALIIAGTIFFDTVVYHTLSIGDPVCCSDLRPVLTRGAARTPFGRRDVFV